MKNARFWTDLVFCTGLPVSLVMGTVGGVFTRQSSLQGRVTFNGRPVSMGTVLFESLDRKSSVDILVMLDQHGHFSGEAEWSLDRAGRTRFRIHVYTDPRRSRHALVQAEAEGNRPAPGNSITDPVDDRAQDPTPPAKVVLASARMSGASASAECSAMAGGRTPRDEEAWFPEVSIGPEPTRIDIDIKD